MQTVTVAREFPVSADRLFTAWTRPEDLKNWWHPMGNQLTQVDNDLREGGTVRYAFKNGETEDEIDISGTYETVQPNAHLVYSWIWQLPHQPVGNGEYKLDIRFEPTGDNSSRLQVAQHNFGSEEAVQPHKQGWEDALTDLARYLEQQ